MSLSINISLYVKMYLNIKIPINIKQSINTKKSKVSEFENFSQYTKSSEHKIDFHTKSEYFFISILIITLVISFSNRTSCKRSCMLCITC